jgi:hypothetical protein
MLDVTMARINHGVPAEITLKLSQVSGARTFVETGTFMGRSARWAAQHFEKVITIEGSETLFNQHSTALKAIKNVEPLFGDSRAILPTVVKQIGTAVFWLDAHWSTGKTFGQGDECPLLEELSVLSTRKGDVVLIDDARLFLHAPPEPHNPEEWPTVTELVHAFDMWTYPPHIQIINDVIFAVPNDLRDLLTEHARQPEARALSFGRLFSGPR